MTTIESRYRELLEQMNQPLTVNQARVVREHVLRVPADHGGIEPARAEHVGLTDLRDYAERKSDLAIDWAENRSARLRLADIEHDLFAELDRMAGDAVLAEIAKSGTNLGDLRSRLAYITASLPETDHIRSLLGFAEARYELAIEHARERQIERAIQPAHEHELDISDSYYQMEL